MDHFIRFLQEEVRFATSKNFVEFIMDHIEPKDPSVEVRKFDLRTNVLGVCAVFVQTNDFSFTFHWHPRKDHEVWTMSNTKIVGFYKWLMESDQRMDTLFPDEIELID